MSRGFLISQKIAIINSMDFSDWINRKYIEWRGDRRRTITEFADYLGVSQPLLSQWMKKGGKVPKSKENVDALIAKYGDETYKILGISAPSPKEEALLSTLPDEIADDMRSALIEINSTLTERGLSEDTPSVREIIIDVLSRHGFTRKE